jgi:hypothetical protein
LPASSAVSNLRARLRRCAAPSFVVGFSSRGSRSRGWFPGGDARVFRPCSRGTAPSCSLLPAWRAQRLRTPCADRLRERTKRQRLGRAMSPRGGTRQPPRCRTHTAEPGPRFPVNGISVHEAQDPARLPRTRFWGSIMGQLVCRTPQPRGLRRPFDRHLPVAPFCEVDDQGSRPDRWPLPSLDSAPRGASRPFLDCSAKMPRIRFYNRRFTSRAPANEHHLWRLRPSAVGNPPAFDFETASGEHGSAASLGGCAGPPRGHPTSSSCVLDGTPPASGWLAATSALARLGWGRAPQPCRLPVTPPNRTL